ncbi:hypothetical protein JIN77_02155 [Verrucomicrobiaceae bacterium R5-34]|nr:hypothetical protein [Verrucomicrobiaceae bacterium R5-34]
MKTTKLPILGVILLYALTLTVSCSKKSENANISAENLFPEPSAFGSSCTINRGSSDPTALAMIDGTYSKPESADTQSQQYVQCVYQKPNLILSMNRFPSIEEANDAYNKGLNAYKKQLSVEPLDGFEVEGYRTGTSSSSRGACFKYGNLVVMILSYNEKDEVVIFSTVFAHLESIAK